MKKIIKTNWINIWVVFTIVYIYSIIRAINEGDFNILQGMLSALILVILYGVLFWIFFIVLLFITDLLLIYQSSKEKLYIMFILQTLIVSIPFVYFALHYSQWIFLVAVVGFVLSQIYRSQKVYKIKS